MQMVSHPELTVEQFPNVHEDGVTSWSWHQKLQEEDGISGNKTIYALV